MVSKGTEGRWDYDTTYFPKVEQVHEPWAIQTEHRNPSQNCQQDPLQWINKKTNLLKAEQRGKAVRMKIRNEDARRRTKLVAEQGHKMVGACIS